MSLFLGREKSIDLGCLSALEQDLKLFWRLKATRWEKCEGRAEELAKSQYGQEETKTAKEIFRALLQADEDYRELNERVTHELEAIRPIYEFLRRDWPDAYEQLANYRGSIDYPTLESAVEESMAMQKMVAATAYPLQRLHHLFLDLLEKMRHRMG